MKEKGVNIINLKTVKNYAKQQDFTPAYIYKLIKEMKMDCVNIDGVQFVDIKKYPVIPTKNK